MNEQNNMNIPNNNEQTGMGNPMPNDNITLGQVVNNNPAPETQEPVNNIPITSPVPGGEVPSSPVTPEPAPMPEPVPMQNEPTLPQQELPTPPEESNTSSVEETFVEPKNKPVALIVIIVLLLLVAGCGALYYFVLDNPKTIFTSAANKIFNMVKFEEGDTGVDYTLDLNITSEDEQAKQIIDVINQIKLEGTIGSKSDTAVFTGNINYKEARMLDYSFQVDTTNRVMYAKVDSLYDKVIKMNLSSATGIEVSQIDTSKKDYEQVVSSMKAAIASALETAEYKKEMTKLNNKSVKKITLSVNEAFLTTLYNKLLQDNAFLESYAKITSTTKEEVTDDINNAVSEAKDNNENIALYLTLLTNNILKLEYTGDDDKLSIEKDDNVYNYNISESSVTKYEGYVKVNEVKGKMIIMTRFTSVDDKVTVDLNATYNKNNNFTLLDTSNAVNYEELTSEDTTGILSKIMENNTLMGLIGDLGMNGSSSESTTSDM